MKIPFPLIAMALPFAAKRDAARPKLVGVYVEQFKTAARAVATDGSVLVIASAQLPAADAVKFHRGAILTLDSATTLARAFGRLPEPDPLIEFTPSALPGELVATVPGASRTVQTHAGEYVRWRDVLPARDESTKVGSICLDAGLVELVGELGGRARAVGIAAMRRPSLQLEMPDESEGAVCFALHGLREGFDVRGVVMPLRGAARSPRGAFWAGVLS